MTSPEGSPTARPPILAWGSWYLAGYAGYVLALQLGTMRLAATRLGGEQFGAFAVLYSANVLFASAMSRWLQHLTIRLYPRDAIGDTRAYWRSYLATWGWASALAAVVAAGAMGLLATRIHVSPTIPVGVAVLCSAVYVPAQLSFDGLALTATRIERDFRTFGLMLFAYAVVLLGGVALADEPAEFVLAIAATGGVVAAVMTLTRPSLRGALRWVGGRGRAGSAPSRSFLRSGVALRMAVFALASISLDYLDRLLVGRYLGAAEAGRFFAYSASVAAVLAPMSLGGSFFHGLTAKMASSPLAGRRVRWRTLGLGVALAPLAVAAVAALALLVLALVYPTVAPPGVMGAFLVFCAGKALFATRPLTEPLISRFGQTDRLAGADLAVAAALWAGVAALGSRGSVAAVLVLSGAALAVSATVALLLSGHRPGSPWR